MCTLIGCSLSSDWPHNHAYTDRQHQKWSQCGTKQNKNQNILKLRRKCGGGIWQNRKLVHGLDKLYSIRYYKIPNKIFLTKYSKSFSSIFTPFLPSFFSFVFLIVLSFTFILFFSSSPLPFLTLFAWTYQFREMDERLSPHFLPLSPQSFPLGHKQVSSLSSCLSRSSNKVSSCLD